MSILITKTHEYVTSHVKKNIVNVVKLMILK